MIEGLKSTESKFIQLATEQSNAIIKYLKQEYNFKCLPHEAIVLRQIVLNSIKEKPELGYGEFIFLITPTLQQLVGNLYPEIRLSLENIKETLAEIENKYHYNEE